VASNPLLLSREEGYMRLSRNNLIAVALFSLAIVLALYGERLFDWASGLPRGDALLFSAAAGGSISEVHRALSQGATVNARSEANMTPLMVACTGRHPHIVKALLELGADPNAHAGYGITPMYNAIVADDPEIVTILINGGADLRVVRYGETLLELANRMECHRAAGVLKRLGAKPAAAA
jgi:ankyrin repeat protein